MGPAKKLGRYIDCVNNRIFNLPKSYGEIQLILQVRYYILPISTCTIIMNTKRERFIIIGIDSGTWDVFDHQISRKIMPNLESLRNGGVSGTLVSTDPPSTPPGWTTLMTGVHPGKHGVLGFDEYDYKADSIRYTNSTTIKVETMWSYLSRLGYKVASLNMPQTYPPFEVNGIQVSGYGCPGMDCDFTWPTEFKDKIIKSIPGYDLTLGWNGGKDMSTPEAFDKATSIVKLRMKYERELFDLVCEECDWDVLLLQIHQIDSFLHRGWKYAEPGYLDDKPEQQKKLDDMFGSLDDFIGYLAKSCGPDGSVFIVSDHGHGPSPMAHIKPNVVLQQNGYLKTKRTFKRFCNRIVKNWEKTTGRTKHAKTGEMKLKDKLMIDSSKTKAFCIGAIGYCSIVVNLKGRQKEGIVEQKDYDKLLKELEELFMGLTDPKTGKRIFAKSVQPGKLHNIEKNDAVKFGDIVFFTNDEYGLSRSMKGSSYIRYSNNPLKGSHRKNGMYVINGDRIKTGMKMDADIADIVPTLYAMLGVELPENMDGRVLEEVMDEEVDLNYTESSKLSDASKTTLSESEEALIKQRLESMGYL